MGNVPSPHCIIYAKQNLLTFFFSHFPLPPQFSFQQKYCQFLRCNDFRNKTKKTTPHLFETIYNFKIKNTKIHFFFFEPFFFSTFLFSKKKKKGRLASDKETDQNKLGTYENEGK